MRFPPWNSAVTADTLPLKVPLLLIGAVSTLAALVLTGHGRSLRWKALTVWVFMAAPFTLWIPAAVLYMIVYPELCSFGWGGTD